MDGYFQLCDQQDRPYTISGLSLFLGVTRQTLLNYSRKEEFFDTIEAAKQRCETFAEEHLFRGGAVTGAMFNLRCNYGWDIPRQTIELPAKQIDQERIDRLVASIFEK